MKDIARMALQPGMEIGADVSNFKGDLIAPAGTVITEQLIQKLARHSIMCVSVKEDIDYAVTRFEKVRLSTGFKNFSAAYAKAFPVYKDIMMNFAEFGKPFLMEDLMQLYHDITSSLDQHNMLLSYLYNTLPTEEDLTYVHCLNSALIAGLFASWFSLSEENKSILIQCAFCYDIGKLKLPYELIWKPDKLTDIEYAKVKTHPIIGFHMLSSLNLNKHILNATLMHHERCDGSGYPSRLTDRQIDAFAKYIAIIDAYEAMTSARMYRQSKNPFQVIEILEKDSFKYDMELLRPILFRLANNMVGLNVLLSDDTVAEVILINQNNMGRPLLRTADNTFIDLISRKDLEIKGIY